MLEGILEKHPEMEYVQLQINYADWEDPEVQSRNCYEVCVKHKKPVIVMEPVKGGLLANLPEDAENLLRKANPGAVMEGKTDVADFSFRFLSGHKFKRPHTLRHFKIIPVHGMEQVIVEKFHSAPGGGFSNEYKKIRFRHYAPSPYRPVGYHKDRL